MGEESPFQAFLPNQFERCLPMEVLIPGTEEMIVANPVGDNLVRSRTTDTTDIVGGNKIKKNNGLVTT
jgi:hypothetical protein